MQNLCNAPEIDCGIRGLTTTSARLMRISIWLCSLRPVSLNKQNLSWIFSVFEVDAVEMQLDWFLEFQCHCVFGLNLEKELVSLF